MSPSTTETRKPRRPRTGIPPHPHDAFFRRVFSVPRHAAGLLRIVLPPVLPVIIHTGRRPWRSPTRLSALIDLPPAPLDALLRPFLPEYGCVLLDLALGGVTREWLRGRAVEPVSATALEILQAGERPEAVTLFAEWLERLAPLRDEPAGASTLAAFLCYLLYVSPIPDARIVDAGEDLPGPASEEFMTAAQQMMARARQEGRQEGLDAGEHAALAAMLLRLARLRFGEVPAETAARIEAAPKADLERFIEGILTAERLNDLFG